MDLCADQRLGGVVAIFHCNTLGQSDYVSPAPDREQLAATAAAIERALRIADDARPLADGAAAGRHDASEAARDVVIPPR